MKTTLLLPALTLLGTTAFAADPDPKPGQPVPAPLPPVSGKATITIDVNGKKETREIDLGMALPLIKASEGGVTFTAHAEPLSQHTWLGIATEEPSDDLRAQLPIADGTGLLVRNVVGDSPAAKAGLQQNDILVRLDDQILANPDQLRKLIGTKKEGDAVHLAYLRKGRETTVEVRLGLHADDDIADDFLKLGKLIGKRVVGEIHDQLKPIIIGRAGEGDAFFITQDAAKAKADMEGKWRLFTNGVRVDVSDSMKQLDKALRDAHVDEKIILQTEKAVADAVAQVQKAVGDADAAKGNIQRELQQAVDEARRAAEKASRAAEEAARKAQSTPPEKPQ